MPPPHAEAMPAPSPTPDNAYQDRPLEHAERKAFQLELARRMANLAELGVPEIDIHDPGAFLRLQTEMDKLAPDARATIDERMMAWAEEHMDAFRAVVGAESAEGAMTRRLIRVDPEAAIDRVAALLRQQLH